jgi:hypothetical protein
MWLFGMFAAGILLGAPVGFLVCSWISAGKIEDIRRGYDREQIDGLHD